MWPVSLLGSEVKDASADTKSVVDRSKLFASRVRTYSTSSAHGVKYYIFYSFRSINNFNI